MWILTAWQNMSKICVFIFLIQNSDFKRLSETWWQRCACLYTRMCSTWVGFMCHKSFIITGSCCQLLFGYSLVQLLFVLYCNTVYILTKREIAKASHTNNIFSVSYITGSVQLGNNTTLPNTRIQVLQGPVLGMCRSGHSVLRSHACLQICTGNTTSVAHTSLRCVC